ncbi:hypothetical protein [Roseomonas chloroacetimidivorans]|jgi:predicted small lipoprotein YifL|uniref:hypothetical protein n=1 Tax=Roseomonas chloroacetimidivorans TaxID=1766656 RepID=UPI003C74C0AA
MTRAIPALIALLGLAACAAKDPLPPATNAAEAACRKEAQDAPQVDQAFERIQIQDPTQRERVLAQARMAERTAYLRCMRAKGLAAPGGVEPVRPPM